MKNAHNKAHDRAVNTLAWTLAAQILAIALVSGSSNAQEPRAGRSARAWVYGKALSKDGKPWAGAEVSFVSHGLAGRPDPSSTDTVHAKPNAKGRFRALLLSGRRYSAWAIEKLGDGQFKSSTVVAGAIAGRDLDLVDVGTRVCAELKFEDLGPHQARAPFSLLLQTDGESFQESRIPLPKNGLVTLPPSPAGYYKWVLNDRFGAPLGHGSLTASLRPPAENTKPERFVARPFMSTQILVRVLDSTGREPVSGAVISSRIYHGRHELGRTDSRGYARIRVLRGVIKSPTKHVLHARFFVESSDHPSLAVIGEEVNLRVRRDLEAMRKAGTPDIVCRLPAGFEIRGTLKDGHGKPAAGATLALQVAVPQRYGSTVAAEFVKTRADGSFRILSANRKHAFRLLVQMTQAMGASIPLRKAYPNPPLAWLASGPALMQGNLDLGDIQLDKLRRLDMQITGRALGSSRYAEAYLAEPGQNLDAQHGLREKVPFAFDRLGRAAVLVNEMQVHSLGVIAIVQGNAGTIMMTKKALLAMTQDPCLLTLPPTRELVGSCVDESDQPIAQAKVYVRILGLNKKSSSYLEGLHRGRWRVLTDDKGHFRVRLPLGKKYQITASKTAPAQRGVRPRYSDVLTLLLSPDTRTQCLTLTTRGHERKVHSNDL